MSRSRGASTGPEPAAQPVSYTALVDDGAVPDSSVGSEAGSLAVPPGFMRRTSLLGRPRRKTRAAPTDLPARFPALPRRTDFWRMRLTLWVADAVIAAVGSLAAIVLSGPVFMVVPVFWLLMTAVRATGTAGSPTSTTSGRSPRQRQLRPAHDVDAIIFSDIYGTRAVLGMSAAMAPAVSPTAGCRRHTSARASASTSARASSSSAACERLPHDHRVGGHRPGHTSSASACPSPTSGPSRSRASRCSARWPTSRPSPVGCTSTWSPCTTSTSSAACSLPSSSGPSRTSAPRCPSSRR